MKQGFGSVSEFCGRDKSRPYEKMCLCRDAIHGVRCSQTDFTLFYAPTGLSIFDAHTQLNGHFLAVVIVDQAPGRIVDLLELPESEASAKAEFHRIKHRNKSICLKSGLNLPVQG